MSAKNVVILGSTGSIGLSTLDVIRKNPGSFNVLALTAFSDHEQLKSQFHTYHPRYLGLVDSESCDTLRQNLKDEDVEILTGEEINDVLGLNETDIVVNAVVGAAGLQFSYETVHHKKILALANKESMVVAGPILKKAAAKTGCKIIPIDSEHSAVFQILESKRVVDVKNIILTASGGPFRELPIEKFNDITPEQALNHPTWKMGRKISIDSATLANKGLEIIEAVNLFDVPVEKVKVVIHPQSIIHSMVEFVDSSILAQLSKPDMRMPITYALFWPERTISDFGAFDFSKQTSLAFEPPDMKKFPALKIAYDVANLGGTAPAIFNAANEVAVAAFLDKAISFVDITRIIEQTISEIEVIENPELKDVLQADSLARQTAERMTGQTAC
ncbi:MAG TPA: 1-deoxy-D-xylulose-5-phosphate reductoisomerase [candidate division Zixibacteria bacterium]|nr:1-deoxy-D-xylulose-5-phosphate reductoisomerase [candidate division Zixibacteria bacterium]